MKECRDHNGTEYPSMSEMCRAYDIGLMTYRERIKNGWEIEDALTREVEERTYGDDHIGMEQRMQNGLTARIIEYNAGGRITAEYEDGAIVEGTFSRFRRRLLRHPYLSIRRGSVNFEGHLIRFITSYKGVPFYSMDCRRCGIKKIGTAVEISEHVRNCDCSTQESTHQGD